MTKRSDHPRDDLIRMVPLPAESLLRVAEDDPDDTGTLVGFPIVFNEWTEINGWEGNFLERVDPGAATKTLAERGGQVKVLFNHGFDPQIGDKPLGKPRVMEPQDFGVWTETPFTDTSYNADLRALLKDGAIDGMSFRFSVSREEWEEEPEPSDFNPRGIPERTIKEFRLYEFGPVTFPAYEATTAGVRARDAYLAYRTAKSMVGETGPERVIVKNVDLTDPDAEITVTDTEPTLTVLEDSPEGERANSTPDLDPPGDEAADTPDLVHLSEDEREPLMSVASYRQRAAQRMKAAEAAIERGSRYGPQ